MNSILMFNIQKKVKVPIIINSYAYIVLSRDQFAVNLSDRFLKQMSMIFSFLRSEFFFE